MQPKPRQFYEARAAIAKALAHPTRLLVLDVLKERPTCVGELTELAGVDQSTVSKHLAVLKNAGLVSAEKKGLTIHYSLRCTCLDSFFNCVQSVLEDKLRQDQSMLLGHAVDAPSC